MITYKNRIKNIEEILYINTCEVVSNALNRQYIRELNEYTICFIRVYLKRCEKNYNENKIIEIYLNHIKELRESYNEKGK